MTVELSWAASTSGGVVSYEVHRNAIASGLGYLLLTTTTTTTTSYVDTLALTGTYCYKVRALTSDLKSSDFTSEVCTTR